MEVQLKLRLVSNQSNETGDGLLIGLVDYFNLTLIAITINKVPNTCLSIKQ